MKKYDEPMILIVETVGDVILVSYSEDPDSLYDNINDDIDWN